MTAKVKLAVLFVDGLDHDFVLRNHGRAGLLRTLFPEDQIFRVEGVLHSLSCLGQVFAGRWLDLFRFQGYNAIPESDGIVNWDALLSHVHQDELIWNRLNRHGVTVGLVEMLGIFLSPELDGFSVTKALEPLGLMELFNSGLTHHPRQAGALFKALCHDHRYPRPLRMNVVEAAALIDGAPEDLSEAQAQQIIEMAGCHQLPDLADDNLVKLFQVLSGVTQQYPVDALFLHTGYFDILLHLFFNQDEHEARITASLDHMLQLLLDHFMPAEIIIYSDHGMSPSAPHLAGEFLHRTCHQHDSAVVMGTGPLVSRYMRENQPVDLVSVYHAALAAFGAGGEPLQPPSPKQIMSQLEQVIDCRDQLMVELSALLEKEG